MLNKWIQKKNLILIAYSVIVLLAFCTTLIFGTSEDKLMILILSLVLPFVTYGFVRLMYKIVSVNASFKIMCIFYYFFLTFGLLSTAMMLIEFIGGFPNGLSPTLGISGSLIIATLDSAKKTIEFENKK